MHQQLGVTVGTGITQAVPAGTVLAGAGSTSLLDGYFKGIVTEVNGTSIGVKFTSHVSNAGIETSKDYQGAGGIYKFQTGNGTIHHSMTSNTGGGTNTGTTVSANVDWFDQQKIALSNSTINWNNIAERPGTISICCSKKFKI